jgi:peptidoglycan/LPS O-acetylase OafA/YrhL
MRSGKWAWLGAVRFLLAAVVVTTHLDICSDPESAAARLSHLTGFTAVLCFFLISGYSISHSIRQRPDGFYRRRFLRIYPIYFAALLLALVPWFFMESITKFGGEVVVRPPWTEIAANFLLLQSFLTLALATISPAWSLSVEFSYYLLAPALRRFGPFLALLLLVASVVFYRHGGYSDFSSQLGLVTFAGLFWAWLLGWLYERERGEGLRLVVVSLLFVAVAGYVIIGIPEPPYWNPHLIAKLLPYGVAAALVVAPAVRLPAFLHHFFDYAGEVSYPWYIVHAPVFFLIRAFTPVSNPWIALGATLALSVAALHLIDFPLRRRERALHAVAAP